MENGYASVLLGVVVIAVFLNWQVASKWQTENVFAKVFLGVCHIVASVGYSFPVLLTINVFKSSVDRGYSGTEQMYFDVLYSTTLLLPGYIVVGSSLLALTFLMKTNKTRDSKMNMNMGMDFKDVGSFYERLTSNNENTDDPVAGIGVAGAFILSIMLFAPCLGFFTSNSLVKCFHKIHYS